MPTPCANLMRPPPSLPNSPYRAAGRTRANTSGRAHNLAIVFWITANSYWMTSEVFNFDAVQVMPHVTGKELALVPFLIGLGVLAYYYLVQKPRETSDSPAATG